MLNLQSSNLSKWLHVSWFCRHPSRQQVGCDYLVFRHGEFVKNETPVDLDLPEPHKLPVYTVIHLPGTGTKCLNVIVWVGTYTNLTTTLRLNFTCSLGMILLRQHSSQQPTLFRYAVVSHTPRVVRSCGICQPDRPLGPRSALSFRGTQNNKLDVGHPRETQKTLRVQLWKEQFSLRVQGPKVATTRSSSRGRTTQIDWTTCCFHVREKVTLAFMITWRSSALKTTWSNTMWPTNWTIVATRKLSDWSFSGSQKW